MDHFKGTCQEFGKVFTEDLDSFEEIDDKVQHHAEGLTNCFKLVQSHPDSPSVQRLWMWLIRSSIKTLLWIDSPPSRDCLDLFIKTLKPWLIDGNFQGFCSEELLEMYRLAVKGPWSQPVLQHLLSGNETSLDELLKVMDDDLECVAYHMSSLMDFSKVEEYFLFAKAALAHPKASKKPFVQRHYQEHVIDVLSEDDIFSQMKDFDFLVTSLLLEEYIHANRSCDDLCNAAVKYLLVNNQLKHLEEILSCWIKLLVSKHPMNDVFDIVRKKCIESDAASLSVEQCAVLANVLWKIVGEKGRMMCVEILYRALLLLSSDEEHSAELKNGILSSIAYFLPNSQVARSCILTAFVLNPTVDRYFQVAKTYKIPYDRDKDTATNFSANLRLSLLEYLHQQWPRAFLQSSSWDWTLLRTSCYSLLSKDDLNTVRLEEQEMEARESNSSPTDESHEASTTSEMLASEESAATSTKCTTLMSGESARETSEMSWSGSGDLCDCVACQMKLQQHSEKQVEAVERVSETKKQSPVPKAVTKPAPASKKDTSYKSSQKKESSDVYYICPEERCQRAVKSKNGMSRHLSKTHRWTQNEIHGFYMSVEAPFAKLPSRSMTSSEVAADNNSATSNKMTESTHVSTRLSENAQKNILPSSSNVSAINSPGSQSPQVSTASPQTFSTSGEADEPVVTISSDKVDSPIPSPIKADAKSAATTQLNSQSELSESEQCKLNEVQQNVIPVSDKLQPEVVESNFEQKMLIKIDGSEPRSRESIADQRTLVVSRDRLEPEERESNITHQALAVSEDKYFETSVESTTVEHVKDHEISLATPPAQLNRMQQSSAMPSLPPIFNTEAEVEREPTVDTVEDQPRESDLLIACPVERCDRVYKHRHTVKEHLEFRHKISSEKAAKMAQTAEYVDDSSPPPPPIKKPDLRTGLDIRNSRGWYWPVDEFLGKEMTDKVTRHNQIADSNLPFLLDCDIIYTLGRAPLSFDSESSAKDIVLKWSFAEKYREKSLKVQQPNVEGQVQQPDLNPIPDSVQKSTQKVKPIPFSTVSVSRKLLKKPATTSIQKFNDSNVKLAGAVKTDSKKGQKEVSDQRSLRSADDDVPKAAITDSVPSLEILTRDVSSQTIWKSTVKFSKIDHYHNVPEAKNKKFKKWKKSDNPIAITIISGGSFVSRKSRTIASQCCQNEIKPIVASSEAGNKKPAPVKRKSASADLFMKPLFSPNDEPVPPAPKLAKRKYDAQTVYHLADKYSDIRDDASVSNDASTFPNNNNKPSFADALNSVNVPTTIADKPKSKRKSSKSLETINVLEPSFHKPRSAAAVSARSNSAGSPGEPSSKKQKTKKPKSRGLSTVFIKKHTVIANTVVKKRVDDLSRQLFPSHDYEELLKHAEELSSSVKPKPAKPVKSPAVQATPTTPSSTTPTTNSTKPKLLLRKKSPVHDSSVSAQSKKKEVVVTSTPVQINDDDDSVKKMQKPTGKRRIDLRKLISSSKQDSTAAARDAGSSSLDDSFSSLASCAADPAIEEIQTSVSAIDPPPEASNEIPASEIESSEIVCPECSKPMSSAFALTCHMRRRHKVRSKKMFFPGQTVDTSPSMSSPSATNKNTAKPPKNVLGPPEGIEACSETATFRSARNKPNASDSSEFASDSKTLSSCYSADVSASSEYSDEDLRSDMEVPESVHISKFVRSAADGPDLLRQNAGSYTEMSGSIPFTKFAEATVSSAIRRKILETAPYAAEINLTSADCIFDLCGSENAANANRMIASEESNVKPIATFSSSPVKLALAIANSSQTCSVSKDLQPKQVDQDRCSSKLDPKQLSEISDLLQFVIAKVESNLSKSSRTVKARKRATLPSTPHIELQDGFYSCAMPNCRSRCKHLRNIRYHFKAKHPNEFSEIWDSVPSHKTALKASSSEKPALKDDSTVETVTNPLSPSVSITKSKDPVEEKTMQERGSSPFEQSREPPVRRIAYTEASLQIQLSSVNLSPRKLSQQQELTRLYNKRMRSKVANALSPASRLGKKSQLVQGKLYKKRKRKESHSSTDSFEADYEAQLSCWGCDAMFHCRKNLTQHVQHHLKNIDSYPYRCDHAGCLYGFKTWDELQKHMYFHDSSCPNVCLFCPNHCRTFRSFRKLVVHEHSSHRNLSVDLFRLRKTYCITPVRNWGKPWKLEDVESTSSENGSFLAEGHRRTVVDDRQCCSKCAKKLSSNQPSVAMPCAHVIANNVESALYDVIETVVEYEGLSALENDTATATSHQDVSAQQAVTTSDTVLTPETCRDAQNVKNLSKCDSIEFYHEKIVFESDCWEKTTDTVTKSSVPSADADETTDMNGFDSPATEIYDAFTQKQLHEADEVQSTCDEKMFCWSDLDDQAPTREPTPCMDKKSDNTPMSSPTAFRTKSNEAESKPCTSRNFVQSSPVVVANRPSLTISSSLNSEPVSTLHSTSPSIVRPSTSLSTSSTLENCACTSSVVSSSDSTCDDQELSSIPVRSTDTSDDTAGLLLTSPAKNDLAKRNLVTTARVCDFDERRLVGISSKSCSTVIGLNSCSDCLASKTSTFISPKSCRCNSDSKNDGMLCSSSSFKISELSTSFFNSELTQMRPEVLAAKFCSQNQNAINLESYSSGTSSKNELVDDQAMTDIPTTPIRCNVSISPSSPLKTPDIVDNVREVALEVVQVVHKLICDVEIEEQADYMRLCGFVPTGVMYYRQCDFAVDSFPTVGVSVYGYNSEAFMTLDAITGDKSVFSNPAYSATTNSPKHQSVCSSQDQPCSSRDAADVPSTSHGSSKVNCDSPFSAFPALPFGHSGVGPSFFPLEPEAQVRYFSNIINRECHAMWRLDADYTRSDICDVSHLDPISTMLFCQHFVVPSLALNLPRPPLRGICTTYPVTTDLPRYRAFTSKFFSYSDNDDPGRESSLAAPAAEESPLPKSLISPQNDSGRKFSDDVADHLALEHLPSVTQHRLSIEDQDNLSTDKEPASQNGSPEHVAGQNSRTKVIENEENIDPASEKNSDTLFESKDRDEPLEATPTITETATDPSSKKSYFYFLDSFSNEIRRVKEQKNKKKLKQSSKPLLKPTSIFQNRGRPRKSYDLLGIKQKLRRSMSEIVAFCDMPEKVPRTVLSKPLKKKYAKKKAKKLRQTSTVGMNPVVSIDPISISSSQASSNETDSLSWLKIKSHMKKSEEATKADERPVVAETSKQETIVETERTEEQSIHNDTAVSRSDRIFEQSCPSDAVLPESSADEQYEEKEACSNSAETRVEISDLDDAAPVSSRTSIKSILLDHSYSLTSDSLHNVAKSNLPSCDIEIHDYGEEVLIDQRCEADGSAKVPSREAKSGEACFAYDRYSLDEARFPVRVSDQISEIVPQTKEEAELKPSCSSQTTDQVVPPILNKSTKEADSNKAFPCIFCLKTFASVELCKQHMKKVHGEEILSFSRKTSKNSPLSPRNVLAVEDSSLSCMKRHEKKIATKIFCNKIKLADGKIGSIMTTPGSPHRNVILPTNVIHSVPVSCQQTSLGSAFSKQSFTAHQVKSSTPPFSTAAHSNQPNSNPILFSLSRSDCMQTGSVSQTHQNSVAKSCAIVAPTFRCDGTAASSRAVTLNRVSTVSFSHPISVPQRTSTPRCLPPIRGATIRSNQPTIAGVPLPLSYRPIGATRGVIIQGKSSVSSAATFSLSSRPSPTSSASLPPFLSKREITKVAASETMSSFSTLSFKALPSGTSCESTVKQIYRLAPVADFAADAKQKALTTACSRSTPNIHLGTDKTFEVDPRAVRAVSKSLSSMPATTAMHRCDKSSTRPSSLNGNQCSEQGVTAHPVICSSTVQTSIKKRRRSCTLTNAEVSEPDMPSVESDGDHKPRKRKLRQFFLCQFCSTLFRSGHDFKVHMLLVHSLHLCAVTGCKQMCSSAVQLEAHMHNDHKPPPSAHPKRQERRRSTNTRLHEAEADDGDAINDSTSTEEAFDFSDDDQTSEKESLQDSLSESEYQWDIFDYSDAVWIDDKISSASLKRMHKKLISNMESLPKHKLFRYISFEVKAFVRRCRMSKRSTKERPFMLCPISSCKVPGEDKLKLYRHVFKEHQLTKISKWVMKRHHHLEQAKLFRAERRKRDDIAQEIAASTALRMSPNIVAGRRRPGARICKTLDIDQVSFNEADDGPIAFETVDENEISGKIAMTRMYSKQPNTILTASDSLSISPSVSKCVGAVLNSPRRITATEHSLEKMDSTLKILISKKFVGDDVADKISTASENDTVYSAKTLHVPSRSLSETDRLSDKGTVDPSSILQTDNLYTSSQSKSKSTQNTETKETAENSETEDRSFKCRFPECGKTIGDQSKFCCHMLTHSPSRVGWHKEEGKLIPLFNPVVVVARSDQSPRVSEQGESSGSDAMRKEAVGGSAFILKSPKNRDCEKAETSGLVDLHSSPLRIHSDSSSPKTPLVVLKKLTSFS